MGQEDLYTTWLGIPSGMRPPTYYALLKIPRFCDDIARIDLRAHRQLDKLEQYVLVPDREKRNACQDLMDEIALARTVLIDPIRRAEYDAWLAEHLGIKHEPRQTRPQYDQPVFDDEFDNRFGQLRDLATASIQREQPVYQSRRAPKRKRRSNAQLVSLIAAIAGPFVIVGIIIAVVVSQSQQPSNNQPAPPHDPVAKADNPKSKTLKIAKTDTPPKSDKSKVDQPSHPIDRPKQTVSDIALVIDPTSIPLASSWTIESPVHRGPVYAITASPDGELFATGGMDGAIRTWRADGKAGQMWVTDEPNITALAWSPDGKTIAAGYKSGAVRIVTVKGRTLETLDNDSEITALTWSPKTSVLAIGQRFGKKIKLWNPEDKSTNEIGGDFISIDDLEWSHDGTKVAAAIGDTKLWIWEASTNQSRLTPALTDTPIGCVAWSPDDSKVVIGSTSISIVDLSAMNAQEIYGPGSEKVIAVDWNVKTRNILVGKEDSMSVIDSATGKSFHGAGGHNGLTGVAWIRDGHRYALTRMNGYVYGSGTTNVLQTRWLARGTPAWASDMAVAPDGIRYMTWSDLENDVVRITDSKGRRQVNTTVGHVRDASWSTNGEIAIAGESHVRIINAETGKTARGFKTSGDSRLIGVAWAPNGDDLALGSNAGKLMINRTGTTTANTEPHTPQPDNPPPRPAVAPSPDFTADQTEKMIEHLGRRATVTGTVRDVSRGRSGTDEVWSLAFDQGLSGFTVLLRVDDEAKVLANVGGVANDLPGKTIAVTGTIANSTQRKPLIYVREAGVIHPARAPVANRPLVTIDANDTEKIRAMQNQRITVRGVVRRVEQTIAGYMLFLFDNGHNAFHVSYKLQDEQKVLEGVVRSANDLVNKQIEATGTVVHNRSYGMPMIRLQATGDLKVGQQKFAPGNPAFAPATPVAVSAGGLKPGWTMISFKEKSDTPQKVSRMMRAQVDYNLSLTQFEVYVPEGYLPGMRCGVLVWMGPSKRTLGMDQLIKALDKRNIIMIRPLAGGAPQHVVSYAVDVALAFRKRHAIDTDRLYLGGFGAGAAGTIAASVYFPDLFKGSLLINGSAYYRSVSVPGASSQFPKNFERPDARTWNKAIRQARLIFMLSATSNARLHVETIYHGGFKAELFRNIDILEYPGVNNLPPEESVNRALAMLDSAVVKSATASFRKAQTYDRSDRTTLAYDAYVTALARGAGQSFASRARERAMELLEKMNAEIQTESTKITALIDNRQFLTAFGSIRKLSTRYGEAAKGAAEKLHRQLEAAQNNPASKPPAIPRPAFKPKRRTDAGSTTNTARQPLCTTASYTPKASASRPSSSTTRRSRPTVPPCPGHAEPRSMGISVRDVVAMANTSQPRACTRLAWASSAAISPSQPWWRAGGKNATSAHRPLRSRSRRSRRARSPGNVHIIPTSGMGRPTAAIAGTSGSMSIRRVSVEAAPHAPTILRSPDPTT